MAKEEIKLLPPGERRRVSPAVIIGIGAGAALATGLALYFLTRAKPAPPPGAATLYGIVTDIETGESIGGVKVTIDGIVTYTNSSGEYAFEGLSPGAYTIKFEKEGYETVIR